MEHLTGINIRSGIELNLPIKEIFTINTAPSGNERIKEIYEIGAKKAFVKYPDLKGIIDHENFIVFSDIKIPHKINESLTAYVYDFYIAYRDIGKKDKIYCEKNIEIEFVNHEKLTFEQYCINVMAAQAFSGGYSASVYMLYPFIGIGDFKMNDYANIHEMVINSNCSMIYFFIYHKKILLSIDNFISTMYRKDIESQKKYLTTREYNSLMKELKNYRSELAHQMGQQLDENVDDMDFFNDEDDEDDKDDNDA